MKRSDELVKAGGVPSVYLYEVINDNGLLVANESFMTREEARDFKRHMETRYPNGEQTFSILQYGPYKVIR